MYEFSRRCEMNMKPWSLVAGIVVLTLICSSALAISKGDLMTYYRTTPVSPVVPEDNQGPAKDDAIDTPTPLPPLSDEAQMYAKWLKPPLKPAIPSSSIGKPAVSPGEAWMKKPSSGGYNPSSAPILMPEHDYSDHDDSDGSDCGPAMNFIKVETERPGEILTDSRTGEPYPVITDIRGNSFLAVEGCSG
jgi:hypothetical protein